MREDSGALQVTIACDDAPDGVDREASLQTLRAALAETRRVEVVDGLPPGAATLRVRWRVEKHQWSDTPQVVVSLALCDATGAELETHEIGSAPEHLPSAIEHPALGFARPERYRELMAARGMKGHVLHPSERDVDPLDARALALAAVLCWPFANLPMHAERFVRVARATGHYEHVLDAVDLHELRGDRGAARALLDDPSLLALDGGAPSAAARSCGLAIHGHLGDALPPLLLCGGAAMAGGEAWRGPQPAARVRAIVAGVLGTLGCRAFRAESGEALARTLRDTFGAPLAQVFAAGVAASTGGDCSPEATPWLRRLAAGDGPLPEALHDLRGAHVAALSLAWARVDWEALSSYALPDVAALEARVTSSPSDEGALLRLAALDPRAAERLLRKATTPLSRAIGLTLRGGLRTDEGQLTEGLGDLDEALALTPWSALVHTFRAMNLRAQGRHDEALAALDRRQRVAPDEGTDAMLRGWFLVAAGRYAEALPVLERGRERLPHNADVWGNLGIALHHLGRHAEALPALERAVELNPRLGPAIHFRALTLAALKPAAAPPAEPPPRPAGGGAHAGRTVGLVLLVLAVLMVVRLLTR